MADTIDKDELNKKNPLGTSQPVRPKSPGAGPQGTGFTNIQRIIGANQGNKLGQAVAGGVQKTGQQVRSNLSQANQQFGQKVQAGALDTDANRQAGQNLVQQATGLQAGQQLGEDQLGQAQKFMAGDYVGPNNLQNASQLVGQAVDAEQLGRLSGTSAGRQGLLQRFVGAPQYTFGQQKLDNLLLGADRNALAQSKAAVRGLGEQVANTAEAAQAQATQQAARNKMFSQDFGKQVGDASGQLDTTLQGTLAAAQQAEAARAQGLSQFKEKLPSLVTALRTNPQELANYMQSAGISPEKQTEIRNIVNQSRSAGVNPTNAILASLNDEQAQGLTREGVMSQAQLAQMNALARLSGRTPEDLQGVGAFKAGQTGADLSRANKTLTNILSGGTDAQVSEAKVPGINNIDVLKDAAAGGFSANNRKSDARIQKILTPDEFDAYKNAVNKFNSAGASGAEKRAAHQQFLQMQAMATERAQRNLQRVQSNKEQTAANKAKFNAGAF